MFKLAFIDTDQLYQNELESLKQRLSENLNKVDELSRLYSLDGELVGSESFTKLDSFMAMESVANSFENAVFLGDTVKCDGEYLRFIRATSFPMDREIPFNFFGNLGDSFIVFKRIPQKQAKRFLDLKRRSSFSATLGNFSNHNSEEEYSLSDEMLSSISSGRECLWNFEFWFVVKDNEEKNLNNKTKALIETLEQNAVKAEVETIGLNYAFLHFKGREEQLLRPHLVHTSFFLNILPLTFDYVMDEGYKFISASSNEVRFHLFNKSSNSYSSIITGPPGSGKSMLANKIFKEEVDNGAKGVILDRGGSYKKLVSYLNGHQIEGRFNPFISKDPFYIRSLILAAIGDDFTDMEKKKLLGLIKDYESDINSIHDLIKIGEQLRSDIKYAFSEIEDYICDDLTSLGDVSCVDFNDFPSSIVPFVLVYILESFNKLEGKKVMIMDECHSLLRNNAEYIETRFRELRKSFGAPIALTQSFDDFIRSDIGRIIAENTYYKFFFKQNIRLTEFVNEEDQAIINNLVTQKGVRSEFYLKSDFNKKSMSYFPSKLEYELFTSDYQDNQFFKTFYEENIKYFNFKDLMHRLVEFKYV